MNRESRCSWNATNSRPRRRGVEPELHYGKQYKGQQTPQKRGLTYLDAVGAYQARAEPAGAGVHHPKRQLFVDTYHRPQRTGDKGKPASITDNTKLKGPKKKTAPKERKQRIPLTPAAKRERQRARDKGHRTKAKGLGLCRHCSKPAIPGQTRCEPCAERHRVSRRVHDIKRNANTKETTEFKRAIALAEKIAAGGPTKCRDCKNPPRPGQTRCDSCANRHNQYRTRSEAKKRGM